MGREICCWFHHETFCLKFEHNTFSCFGVTAGGIFALLAAKWGQKIEAVPCFPWNPSFKQRQRYNWMLSVYLRIRELPASFRFLVWYYLGDKLSGRKCRGLWDCRAQNFWGCAGEWEGVALLSACLEKGLLSCSSLLNFSWVLLLEARSHFCQRPRGYPLRGLFSVPGQEHTNWQCQEGLFSYQVLVWCLCVKEPGYWQGLGAVGFWMPLSSQTHCQGRGGWKTSGSWRGC